MCKMRTTSGVFDIIVALDDSKSAAKILHEKCKWNSRQFIQIGVDVVSRFISFQYNIIFHFSGKHSATLQLNAGLTQQFISIFPGQVFVYTASYKLEQRGLNGIISTFKRQLS